MNEAAKTTMKGSMENAATSQTILRAERLVKR